VRKNGLYTGISNEEYHSVDGISSTQFSIMEKSQKAYELRHLFKYTTQAFNNGNLIHSCILEPHTVEDIYMEADTKNCDTQNAKAKQLLHNDKIVVGNGAIREAKEIAEKVWAVYPEIFEDKNTQYEVSAFYNNKEFGLLYKARPDILYKIPNTNNYIIFDLKSSRENTKRSFEKNSIAKYNYDLAGAWYMDTLKLLGINVVAFGWIVVPTSIPNIPFSIIASGELLEKGRDKYNKLLNEYIEYKNNGIDTRKYEEAHSWEYIRELYGKE
jgi:hypothetical protein